MSKGRFLAGSFVLLGAVIIFVIYQSYRNPEKAAQLKGLSVKESINAGIEEFIPSSSATEASNTEASSSTEELTQKQWSKEPNMGIDTAKRYTAIISTTKGIMTFELFASETPKTVNNFVFLANKDFYNNTKFHRIIKDFMVQGGDPKGNGSGGPGYDFEDEPVTRDYVRGTLAMANRGPNTNGSQFFIVTKDAPLPKSYTIFGLLLSGDEVLQRIAETPVTASPMGEMSLPTEEVLVNAVEIHEK